MEDFERISDDFESIMEDFEFIMEDLESIIEDFEFIMEDFESIIEDFEFIIEDLESTIEDLPDCGSEYTTDNRTFHRPLCDQKRRKKYYFCMKYYVFNCHNNIRPEAKV